MITGRRITASRLKSKIIKPILNLSPKDIEKLELSETQDNAVDTQFIVGEAFKTLIDKVFEKSDSILTDTQRRSFYTTLTGKTNKIYHFSKSFEFENFMEEVRKYCEPFKIKLSHHTTLINVAGLIYYIQNGVSTNYAEKYSKCLGFIVNALKKYLDDKENYFNACPEQSESSKKYEEVLDGGAVADIKAWTSTETVESETKKTNRDRVSIKNLLNFSFISGDKDNNNQENSNNNSNQQGQECTL